MYPRPFWMEGILSAWEWRSVVDKGALWEHIVLNELQAYLPVGAKLRYWCTRHGNEVDFVVLRRGGKPVAIECKWSADRIDASDLRVFRNHYAGGENYIVAHDVDRPRERETSGVELTIIGLEDLVRRIAAG